MRKSMLVLKAIQVSYNADQNYPVEEDNGKLPGWALSTKEGKREVDGKKEKYEVVCERQWELFEMYE
jgi:hypothetical protein